MDTASTIACEPSLRDDTYEPSTYEPSTGNITVEHAFDTVRVPDGTVVEVPPERCPARHALLPNGTLVGWSPCTCTPGESGHMTYRCRYVVNGVECGRVLSFPPCRDPSAGPSWWA